MTSRPMYVIEKLKMNGQPYKKRLFISKETTSVIRRSLTTHFLKKAKRYKSLQGVKGRKTAVEEEFSGRNYNFQITEVKGPKIIGEVETKKKREKRKKKIVSRWDLIDI